MVFQTRAIFNAQLFNDFNLSKKEIALFAVSFETGNFHAMYQFKE